MSTFSTTPHVGQPSIDSMASPLNETIAPDVPARQIPWSLVAASVIGVFVLIALLPFRTYIPPLIESDYCYQLIAADRMFEGKGLTAPLPAAPHQPWSWQADWSFLTQWPAGYSVLVWSVRAILDVQTIEACQWIGVAAAALAIVGWFVWTLQLVPAGPFGFLLAVVACASAVSVPLLINPTSDALLVAAVPYCLLFATGAVRACLTRNETGNGAGVGWSIVLAGVASGSLFWIRYAGIFVPVAIGLFMLIALRRQRAFVCRRVSLFAISAIVPIAALVVVNSVFGSARTIQSQFNLGESVSLGFSPRLFTESWWRFTDLGFYDYHRFTHWLFALWPFALIACFLLAKPARQFLSRFATRPACLLCGITLSVFFLFIVGVTTVFGDKYDYVGLDRYYLPVKPLYYSLFVAPIAMVRFRPMRWIVCAGFVVACLWISQQDWKRPYLRQLTAGHAVTSFGARSRCFEPGAKELYCWLEEYTNERDDVVVISNFHEYVSLETGISALPVPTSRADLDKWLERLRASRELSNVEVLFVLDLSNHWRDYWIPDPKETTSMFHLTPFLGCPPRLQRYVLHRQELSVAAQKKGRDTDGGISTTPSGLEVRKRREFLFPSQ